MKDQTISSKLRQHKPGVNAVLGLTFDHVDVVGSIADGQRDGFLVLLHQTHHVGLLLRGNTAADDRLTLAGHVHKVDLWRHLTV